LKIPAPGPSEEIPSLRFYRLDLWRGPKKSPKNRKRGDFDPKSPSLTTLCDKLYFRWGRVDKFRNENHQVRNCSVLTPCFGTCFFAENQENRDLRPKWLPDARRVHRICLPASNRARGRNHLPRAVGYRIIAKITSKILIY